MQTEENVWQFEVAGVSQQNETAQFACFTKHPTYIENLRCPHSLTDRKLYFVVKTVVLDRIDYENFTTDLTVERRFLEIFEPLCHARHAGLLPCILVRQRGRRDGVLAVPDSQGFVVWAAYLPNANQ